MVYTLKELKKMMKENGGSLYLEGCTGITALPDNLTVGGSLDLRGTGITALPDNLTVGGYLDLRGTGITARHEYKRLKNGDYVPNKYLYADEILTHVKRSRRFGNYTYYYGKIKGKNVISDGVLYAHCATFREGVIDLEFKKAKDRGAKQYKGLTLESVVKKEDAITMYRVITGACKAGTAHFLEGLREIKAEYTINEIIEITKGQYGAGVFENFFKKED